MFKKRLVKLIMVHWYIGIFQLKVVMQIFIFEFEKWS